MQNIKKVIQKYGHIWTALYLPCYLVWFCWLEQNVKSGYKIIHCAIDDYIPFCEYFIVPYLLWFLIIPAMWLYLFFQNKKEFYQYIMFLYSGMTLSLLICTIFPNGQDMRPIFNSDKNIFTQWIHILYDADTSTNVFPSIHVYNSLAFYIAVKRNAFLSQFRAVRVGSLILTVSICLATVFLKQHSILDGVGAFVLALFLYNLVYVRPERSPSVLKNVKTRQRTVRDRLFS